ncbi:MAG: TfoX/Sxy family protein [Thermoplasmata archaeon]|nr:TfoX/Sxy family protein [Thermoplasmata archaeon]MCI4337435.1 TfoX/Sxy family protein [Thermoplasmata archaeon]
MVSDNRGVSGTILVCADLPPLYGSSVEVDGIRFIPAISGSISVTVTPSGSHKGFGCVECGCGRDDHSRGRYLTDVPPVDVAGMKMPKAGGDAVAAFRVLLKEVPEAVERPVFGQPAAFVRGNMFLGVFGTSVFVRLSEADRALAHKELGARPLEPMPGRPMREYVVLPEKVLVDLPLAASWTARARKYATELPVKKPKK